MVIDINFLIIAYRQAAYMQAVKAGLNFEEYYNKDLYSTNLLH